MLPSSQFSGAQDSQERQQEPSIFANRNEELLRLIKSLQDFIYKRLNSLPIDTFEDPQLRLEMYDFSKTLAKLESANIFEEDKEKEAQFHDLLLALKNKAALKIERVEEPSKRRMCRTCLKAEVIYGSEKLECMDLCIICICDLIYKDGKVCPFCWASITPFTSTSERISTRCCVCKRIVKRKLMKAQLPNEVCADCQRTGRRG